jgi:hypothetical protein
MEEAGEGDGSAIAEIALLAMRRMDKIDRDIDKYRAALSRSRKADCPLRSPSPAGGVFMWNVLWLRYLRLRADSTPSSPPQGCSTATCPAIWKRAQSLALCEENS